MPVVEGYTQFGGQFTDSALLKNLLAFAGVANPSTRRPFSEALCFGIAGGIGAGYSFCPSVIRHGCGTGVHIPSRYREYATDATWFVGFFDRLAITTHIAEASSASKAHRNLCAELEEGRPAVVWCGRGQLSYLPDDSTAQGCFMYNCVVHGIDEERNEVHIADRAAGELTLSVSELQEARGKVCSHKHRLLTFDPPAALDADRLQSAIQAGIQVCAQELLHGKMKTFSLPGLEIWAKMINNRSSKDGWLKIFPGGRLFDALADIFRSIETVTSGGGLNRALYGEFLEEAGQILDSSTLRSLAKDYRSLSRQWTALADALLPSTVKSFRKAKELLLEQAQLFVEKGAKGAKAIGSAGHKFREIRAEMVQSFPLDEGATKHLVDGLSVQILELHQAEVATAEKLQKAVG